jgi:hypothetical protein
MLKFQPASSDHVTFGGLIAALLGVTAIYLSAGPITRPSAVPRAHWCTEGEAPSFQFGFADLAARLRPIMGEPIECEHGDDWTSDTRQTTTTGVATYQWCTNTPAFTRGQEHWALMPEGLQHWSGDGGPAHPPPMVRVPDLRHPC